MPCRCLGVGRMGRRCLGGRGWIIRGCMRFRLLEVGVEGLEGGGRGWSMWLLMGEGGGGVGREGGFGVGGGGGGGGGACGWWGGGGGGGGGVGWGGGFWGWG